MLAIEGYDAQPAGFVLAFVAADEAEIITFAVVPGCHRQGIGRRLVRSLIDLLGAEGVASLFLEVAADNEPALGLYRSMGFRQVGARRSYYPREGGRTADALMLKLEISPPYEDGRSLTPSL
ncbi:MAG: GNAT family N-acetyltransferase [Hyphomicrobiaceae bacterium]|nr:MAG: GNAT family N-acetyltransferase [Hyphomicrobiaceae bacterium]